MWNFELGETMGMFDTIHFAPPIEVPGWNQSVSEAQTKLFGSLMQDYTLGSLLPETPVLTGVVEDFLWCAPEEKGESGETHPVYFAIWHRILAGAYLTAEEAEERLRTVDRLDLITWLDQAQRGQRRWMGRYRSLFADVRAWQAQQAKAESDDASEDTPLTRLWMHRLPEEILEAPDPLAAILEMHSKKEDDSEDDGRHLFW